MKTLFTFLVLTFFLTTAQAQDIDATLGGNTSSEGFSVKDNGGNNLFRVGGDGRVGIATTTPTANLHLNHDQFVPEGGLRLEQSFTGNEWLLYTSQSSNDLRLFYNGDARGAFDDVTGDYTAVSDERLKKNIEPVEDVLAKLNTLQPKKYHFLENSNSDEKHYGFIAQDLEKIFPELVSVTADDGDGMVDLRMVSYTELIPILVKAIQEQQKQIEELQIKIK